MDEPFGSLDARTRVRMRELFSKLWGQYKKSVLFVTHDIDEAILLADRVAVMSARPATIAEESAVALPRPRSEKDLFKPAAIAMRERLYERTRQPSGIMTWKGGSGRSTTRTTFKLAFAERVVSAVARAEYDRRLGARPLQRAIERMVVTPLARWKVAHTRARGITLKLEWNCHIDMTDFGNGLDPIVWLRYFATDEERIEFATEHNLKTLPPHEDPPCDRDRRLPIEPGVPSEGDDEDPFPSEEDLEDDPLGLNKVDSEIRGEHSREDDFGITGGEVGEGWQRPMDQLQRSGAAPIPPAELTDETLTAKLWELLHHLACRGFYALHTDHFSDRELYTALWDSGLRDDALMPGGRCRTGGWFHDFIGSGSDEDNEIWLRFYASDEERAEYAKDWPNDPIPPREKPPFNRDWRLPKGPF